MNPQLLREIDELHAQICEGLADPKRIALLYALREGATTVNQLAETLQLPQATVSRHLKILRERNLVAARRDGMNVYYSLTNDKILEALDLLRQVLNDNLNRSATLAKAIA
ncbi:MAG: winged helix-turn-helix transcriptional regulator [Chloroflexi bacterium]|nr:winged helix-turn-helix transcriptional regulator [Chloroflexota bacterium]